MPQNNIKIGQINFTNCLPVNYSFSKWNIRGLSFHNDCPSQINKMMQSKIIDIAPVSSIEYLNNTDKYTLIDNICISSYEKVGSVILFSNYEMNDLSGKKIALPYTSASSIALLKILLYENNIDLNNISFHNHRYENSLEESLKNKYDAILYIGDPALCSDINYKDNYMHYDLGECWYNMTDLPMVFGTWVARSYWTTNNNEDFVEIKNLLDKAVESGLNMYFNDVINIASQNLNIDKTFIIDYLTNKIKYKFTNDHLKSLQLFKKMNDRLI
jgi:chorismate dehydratase